MIRQVMVETRELVAKVEKMVRRPEVESRARRLEAETGNPHAKAVLQTVGP